MMLISALCSSLDQHGDVLEEASLHFDAWAISLVPSEMEIRARKLQAVVASKHAVEHHPFFHWKVEMAVNGQVS